MKLLSIKYTSIVQNDLALEVNITPKVSLIVIQNDWVLKAFDLNPKVNLIVAQNTTGKSKTIKTIAFISQLLRDLNSEENFPLFELECIFQQNEKNTLKYIVKTFLTQNSKDEDPEIHYFEKLFLNEKLLLSRNREEAELYSVVMKKFTKIAPPNNKLVIQIRRDKAEYPFFEDLISWAQGTKLFEFSAISPKLNKQIENNHIGKLFSKLSEKQHQSIINDLNSIGYQIESIKTIKWKEEYIVSLKEKGIENEISETQISQGLIRALAVLVFIEYSFFYNSVTTILIDDLGEGLDYERATKLGKLLVEKLENSKIQFIATTNDSFLMDVIPIKYWNILQRDGNTVRSLNYQNSKDLFDKFRLTGLSNFDLFSSDYLLQKQ